MGLHVVGQHMQNIQQSYRALRNTASYHRAAGYSWADIAAAAGVSRRTLRRYLRRADRIDRAVERTRREQTP